MELTDKQSKEFIDAYMGRYAEEGETTTECSKRIIHKGIVAKEEDEENFFRTILREILGKKADKLYKYRTWGKETNLDKAVNSLYLQYGPRCIEK